MNIRDRVTDLNRTAITVARQILAVADVKVIPSGIWLHTNSDGSSVRVNVQPGEGLKVIRLLKGVARFFPVHVRELPITISKEIG